MPEWCIYITGAEGALAQWGLNGVFAYLSYDEVKCESALRFLFDMNDDNLLATLPICLNTSNIQGSMERAAAEALRTLTLAGKGKEADEMASIDLPQFSRALVPLVNLVLYILQRKCRDRPFAHLSKCTESNGSCEDTKRAANVSARGLVVGSRIRS